MIVVAASRPAPVAADVVREALAWVGTPYRHQGSRKGIGCDCLGLVRGVWRALYGVDAERPGPYAQDWAEAGGAEVFLAAMRRNMREVDARPPQAGDVLLFRWRPHLPAKHAGILVSEVCFVHAYETGGAVAKSAFVPQWRGRVAAAFSFPDLSEISN